MNMAEQRGENSKSAFSISHQLTLSEIVMQSVSSAIGKEWPAPARPYRRAARSPCAPWRPGKETIDSKQYPEESEVLDHSHRSDHPKQVHEAQVSGVHAGHMKHRLHGTSDDDHEVEEITLPFQATPKVASRLGVHGTACVGT